MLTHRSKVVVTDNKLEANMCVFSPQFSGKDITVEAMRQALKDAHVVYGIDEELLEEIAANKLYDKIFTVASGYAAVDGENGRVNNLLIQTRSWCRESWRTAVLTIVTSDL
ncbi:protein containing DUF342 [human gut metagenome]|uniref:Protein containing DUF342 n=1 Tax=human gut metagenome TaxID=408170 RepID=K1TDG5_9ZZZZ